MSLQGCGRIIAKTVSAEESDPEANADIDPDASLWEIKIDSI
jgi:hypothetical protein